MHKEIISALIGGGCTIIAALIGIASLDITPSTIANSKKTASEYAKLIEENTVLKQQYNDLDHKYDDLLLLYESLAESKSTNETSASIDSTIPETTSIQTGWIKNARGWMYCYPDGYYQKDGWMTYDNLWYCFDSEGYMRTGWIPSDDGTLFYCDLNNGAMLTNQWTPDGYWVDEKGIRRQSQNESTTPSETDSIINNTEQKVSIFTMSTFQGKGFWWDRNNVSMSKNDFIDTYDNEYLSAFVTGHGSKTKDSSTVPTYLLDGKYKQCRGKFAWTKADKNLEGSIWIEFYSGDSLIYQTETITATDRAVSFEFSVEGLETLTIVKNASTSRSIHAVYPYLDLIK